MYLNVTINDRVNLKVSQVSINQMLAIQKAISESAQSLDWSVMKSVTVDGNLPEDGDNLASVTYVGSKTNKAAIDALGINAGALGGKAGTSFLSASGVPIAVEDFDTLTTNGIYTLSNTTGPNTPYDNMYGQLLVTVNNFGPTQSITQTTIDDSGELCTRVKWGTNAWGGWDMKWGSRNMGTGSGLDADLLDGQDGSYYITPLGAIILFNGPVANIPSTNWALCDGTKGTPNLPSIDGGSTVYIQRIK